MFSLDRVGIFGGQYMAGYQNGTDLEEPVAHIHQIFWRVPSPPGFLI